MPPDELPRFEVASVKKATGPTTSSRFMTPPARVMISNLPLRSIFLLAFGSLRDYQLDGLPGWTSTERFTINARAASNVPRNDLLLMLRALLVDRFQLKYRVDTRQMQAYVLTTADEEWKPNARMKPVDCSSKPAAPPAGPIRPDQMPCGMTMLGSNGIQARGTTMERFVSLLSSIGGLGLVYDRTGLTGTYNIELDASPSAVLRSSALLGSSLGSTAPDNLLPSVGDGRSLDSAIRDLGLKLERRREPVEVLVVESLSQPDED